MPVCEEQLLILWLSYSRLTIAQLLQGRKEGLREGSHLSRVTIWIVILTIFTQGCTTYDILHLLHIPLHCNYDTHPHNTKKRSIMATDGSTAAWFAG